MCKPHRCPHIAMTGNICVYCPGGPDSDFEYSTQSYTGYEVQTTLGFCCVTDTDPIPSLNVLGAFSLRRCEPFERDTIPTYKPNIDLSRYSVRPCFDKNVTAGLISVKATRTQYRQDRIHRHGWHIHVPLRNLQRLLHSQSARCLFRSYQQRYH